LAVVGIALEVDRLAMEGVLVLVQVADEVDYAPLVLEGVSLARPSLVDQLDAEVPRQERRLAQALEELLVVEHDVHEHIVVRKERDRGPGALGLLAALELAARLAALVVLGPDVAVAADLE